MRPIVYLDSSDYSTLADPARDTPELRKIREQLIAWARAGRVDFRYSQVHISEMSATREDRIDEAVHRLSLLYDLCQQRCFIGYWDVIELEGRRLERRNPKFGTVFSNNGDWIADIDGTVKETVRRVAELRLPLLKQLREATSSRAHRRAAEPTIAEFAKPVIEQIANDIPLSKANPQIFGRFLIGQASESELRKAFAVAYRNPVLVNRWLYQTFETMGPALGFLRRPSSEMHAQMVTLRNWVIGLRRARASDQSENRILPGIDDLSKGETLLELVLNAENVFGMSFPLAREGSVDWDALEASAPGMLTALRTHLQVALASSTEVPRNPLSSDFLDILHTVYAPYVDVFRTDRTMAHFVKQALGKRGTHVVGRLPELIPAIESCLACSSAKSVRRPLK